MILMLNQYCAGRPLVMVVGRGNTLSHWAPDLLQTLAAGRQVNIFDNRGIGMSTDSDPARESTVEGYAQSTVDLIEALDLDQPDILGISLGGFITLTTVVDFGDMVNRVILSDTTSGGLGMFTRSPCMGSPVKRYPVAHHCKCHSHCPLQSHLQLKFRCSPLDHQHLFCETYIA